VPCLWGEPMTIPVLLAMRLADMTRVHPDQIEGTCAQCGHVVAIFPSGQRLMKDRPDTRLMCQVCQQPTKDTKLAPGADLEVSQSVRKDN
jgi:hypothetical protein